MASCNCIDRVLSRVFYRYGKLVARHPLVFFLGPMILAAGLAVGIMFLRIETDIVFLFSPDASQARKDAPFFYEVFPVDYNNYWQSRGNGSEDLGARVIIKPLVGGNILTEEAVSEILRFDRGVQALTVEDSRGISHHYGNICASHLETCQSSPLFTLFKYNASLVGSRTLTYPFVHLPDTDVMFLGGTLGDVKLAGNPAKTVERVGLFATLYSLKTTPEFQSLGIEWEEMFSQYADDFRSDVISISYAVSTTLDNELVLATDEVFPLVALAAVLLCTFSVLSCAMADWVFSKSVLGIMGIVSASLAVAATLGLLSFAGVNFNIVALSMPFLILGIGLDDMFIMIAHWRKTNPSDSVEERLGKTYSEAAISITITTLTDAMAFGFGAISPLPAVRVFCFYTGVAVLFDYLFQITFFGACMVYGGHREASSAHCLTFKRVLPKRKDQSIIYRLFCAGGLSAEDRKWKFKRSCETGLMRFFRDYYGPALMTPVAKIFTLVVFCVYIGGAVYGCLRVTEGLELKLLAREGSQAFKFFETRTEYFLHYGPSVSVAIREKIEYSDPNVQRMVENVVTNFESSDYFHSSQYTEFWLRDYLRYLRAAKVPSNVSREVFMSTLAGDFLKHPRFIKYTEDIVFADGSNRTEIESSRFILLADSLITTNQQIRMMAEVRKKSEESELALTPFSPYFIVYEQFVRVRSLTIQNISIAIGSMFLVALVFIPHPLCSLVVALSIVSIQVGIIGYMSLWSVHLDGISMINIILCIGFSVDFSAHITYAFIGGKESCPGKHAAKRLSTAEQRAVMGLYSLGMPILQGALSTIIAIVVLNWSSSYVFRAFFKIMSMVMMFGMLHSLVFLPVLLSCFGGCIQLDPLAKEDPKKHFDTSNIYTISKREGQQNAGFKADDGTTEN
ncbi:patched domain-containing protein 3-like [Diadema antillarum]|uniref:patched domain-containing protein 3-like n=1 Tax=Diadema antillarum TaxID=105358 RepID=UPI003A858E05